MPYQDEIKAIKLLQKRSADIDEAHEHMGSELADIKQRLQQLAGVETEGSAEFQHQKEQVMAQMSSTAPLKSFSPQDLYDEAVRQYPETLGLGDILTVKDFAEAERKISHHVVEFNRRYSLDGWDYAIAGSCGLFAAMLDMLCVQPPMKPSITKFATPVNGIFNRWTQDAFNAIFPPEMSAELSRLYKIGSADTSVGSRLLGAPAKVLNPVNHRLRSLAHDPVLGFIVGVRDMLDNKCTVVVDGKIVRYLSAQTPLEGQSLWGYLGTMFGHLCSDVNAPSLKGNRGMGLPAPFMGLLRMLEGIPLGDSNFGRQIEWMYTNGYDFRHFITTSIPMTIMEVLLRVFYVGKQVKLYKAPFGETILHTMPMQLHPRFRMMLAIAYGTSSAVNAGKMYITQNILNANYASWLGLAWNGFHALRWALLDRHLKLWDGILETEVAEILAMSEALHTLERRARNLPC